jgi:peptidyl-tRNA hydrolase, PTH2 family
MTMETTKPNPVMYIFVNKAANMSPGKMAAQVAHAAVKASDGSSAPLRDAWNEYGFYTKLVMQARNAPHLETIQKYLKDRNIASWLIIDEGRTELEKHTPTALGVEIIDKDTKGEIFKSFDLYKPELSVTIKWND